jgi:hypothetical protein
MTWWIRAFLITSIARGLYLGFRGLTDASKIPIPLQLTPLNAAFVSALYLAGSLGLILTLFVRDRADARPFVIGVGVVTTLLLCTTLLNWPAFDHTLSPRLVGWLGSYIFDPIAVALLVATHRLVPASNRGRHRLTRLFLVEAAVLGGLGLVALLVPAAAAALWPWLLPPVLAQLYSCFLLAFATIALLAARENRPAVIRNFTITSLALAVFVLLASLPYLGRFVAGPATWAWFGVLLAGAAAFGTALAGAVGRPLAAGAPASPPE